MEPFELIMYAKKNKKLIDMGDYMLIKFDKEDIINLKNIGFDIQTKYAHNGRVPIYLFKNIRGFDNFITGLKHPFLFINNDIITCFNPSEYKDEGYYLCNKELFVRNCKNNDKSCEHLENIIKKIYPYHSGRHYTKQEIHNLKLDILQRQKYVGSKIKSYAHILTKRPKYKHKDNRIENLRQILKSKWEPKNPMHYTHNELKPYMSKLFGRTLKKSRRSKRKLWNHK